MKHNNLDVLCTVWPLDGSVILKERVPASSKRCSEDHISNVRKPCVNSWTRTLPSIKAHNLHYYSAHSDSWHIHLSQSLNRTIVPGPLRHVQRPPVPRPRPRPPSPRGLLNLTWTVPKSIKQTNFCLVLLSCSESLLWSEPSREEKQNGVFLRL